MYAKKMNIVQVVLLICFLTVVIAFLNSAFHQENKISAQKAEIIKLQKENSSLKEELKIAQEQKDEWVMYKNIEKCEITLPPDR